MQLRIFILFALLLQGCSLTVDLPVNRLSSPETLGASEEDEDENESTFNRVIHYGVVGNQTIHQAKDIRVYHPDFGDPYSSPTSYGQLGIGASINPKLDLIASTQGITPLTMGFKYQLLGEPKIERKHRNLAFAVQGKVAVSTKSGRAQTYNGGGIFSHRTNDTMVTTFSNFSATLDFSPIIGFRLNDYFLFYSALFVTKTFADGYVTQKDAGIETRYEFNHIYKQKGAALGMTIDVTDETSLFIESAYAQVNTGKHADKNLLWSAAIQLPLNPR